MRFSATIPTTPSPDLIPNKARTQYWRKRHDAAAALREDAGWAYKEALPHRWQTLTGPVTLTLHIAWGKGRNNQYRWPDLDAGASSAKAAIDALIDIGVLADDDQIEQMHVSRSKDPAGKGYMLVTVEPIAAEMEEAT